MKLNSKQKYSKKKLLALDNQSGLLEVDTFFIPTCCVCQLVRERLSFDSEPTRGDSADEQGGGSNLGERSMARTTRETSKPLISVPSIEGTSSIEIESSNGINDNNAAADDSDQSEQRRRKPQLSNQAAGNENGNQLNAQLSRFS